MNQSEIVKQLAIKEGNLGLYNFTILDNVPVWRLLRFKYCGKYMRTEHNIQYDTRKKRIKITELLRTSILSFFQILKLLIAKKTKHNIVFAFPRLVKTKEVYFDRLTDPLIDFSDLKDDSIIFQRHLAGKHLKPRYNEDKIILNDSIEGIAMLFSFIILPFTFLIFRKSISGLYNKSKPHFNLTKKDYLYFNMKISSFYISYKIYKHLYRILKIKNIILVNRELSYPATYAAKKSNIKSFEIQHGITHNWTLLYSGTYSDRIDPDYFLTFGDQWIGKQMGMPLKKMKNIGWAYNTFLQNHINNNQEKSNSILVISSAHISDNIFKACRHLAKNFQNTNFEIRLHPQEQWNDDMITEVEKTSNLSFQDNTTESSAALLKYDRIIGEKSSVLYEAKSLGKLVGKISFAGLSAEFAEGFITISNDEEFEKFINSSLQNNNQNSYYSDFNKKLFNSLLK